MNVRVDADLWQRFERLAHRSGLSVEEVITSFMEDYVAQAPSIGFRGNLAFDFGPEFDVCDGKGAMDRQIDLEEYLGIKT